MRFGKPPDTSRMSSLSRRTITSSRAFLPRTGTPRQKRCGIEDLQQGGEAVRVAVVRRGRQEQAVLEAAGDVADGSRDLRVDGVAAPLAGAAWCASSRISREPGDSRPSQSRSGPA